MKTILASTYAVNPYKGSEDGMGWNYVMQIARFNKVIAITRKNNQASIEKYILTNPDERYANIQFEYYDLPDWVLWIKKKTGLHMPYFLLWQYFIVQFVKHRKLQFDILHNLNFHNDWSPSFLWKLGKPFVWGPIGHHPEIPTQYLKQYSLKYRIIDYITYSIKQLFWNYSIALKNTVSNATHILCMNEGVCQVLDLSHKSYSVYPSVASQDFGYTLYDIHQKTFDVISAGRFVPLKGFDLAIEAFAQFLGRLKKEERAFCKFTLVGDGPEKKVLEKLIQQNKIEDYVEIIPWMERNDLMDKMKSADAFLFPSHEGAGMVVAEALSFALPVVCLDNYGPGTFVNAECGFKIEEQNYEDTVSGLADGLYKLQSDRDLKCSMSQSARIQFEEIFHWDRRGEYLNNIYNNLNYANNTLLSFA